ncbi:MAG TPA: hypothetical protein VN450_08000, partial [Candidatus Methylomirabilis sp.]|nr:hypothetical protein [Candidatus Methylomirabilis sp.]
MKVLLLYPEFPDTFWSFRHVVREEAEGIVEELVRDLEAGKMQNVKADLLESVRRIQERGMEVMGGFILGFDQDPPEIFEKQIAFIKEAAIPVSMVGLLTALPNT